jgi:tetratricopeptide (TPR) repeat protein
MAVSKLYLLCDKLIEAGWLAMVVITPLFFNAFISDVTQTAKITLISSIAAFMLTAWVIKWLDSRSLANSSKNSSLCLPMVLPILFFVGASSLATLFSINPQFSLFGSWERPLGLQGIFGYAIVIVMILQGLRTRAQLERLMFALVLPSIPIALYSVMQRLNLDPVMWQHTFGERTSSTLGNPIFMASYMIMVAILSLSQVWMALSARDVRRSLVYVVIALAQLGAIFFSGSRGPWLGFVGGLVVAILLMAVVWNRKMLVWGGTVLALAAVLFLILFNLPNSPLESLRLVPGIGRLGTFSSDGSTAFRAYTWDNVARLVFPHTPILFPDGAPDAFNSIRPWLGYGPDTLALVYRQLALPDSISQGYVTDRSHNDTWDVLVTTGVLGLIAYQLLWLSVFFFGLRGLGLIRTVRERNELAMWWIGLGTLGGLGALVLNKSHYIGLALPIGNLVGVCLYLVRGTLTGRMVDVASSSHRQSKILIAVLASLSAHYIEIQFGLDMPATQILFWVLSGLVVAMATNPISNSELEVEAEKGGLVRPSLAYAVLIALSVVVLLFDFVDVKGNSEQALDILWRVLTFNPLIGSTNYVMLGFMILVWGLSIGLVLATLQVQGPSLKQWLSRMLLLCAFSLGMILVFGVGLGIQISAASTVSLPVETAQEALVLLGHLVRIVDYYTVSMFSLILLLAVVLAFAVNGQALPWVNNKRAWVFLVPIVLLAGIGIDTFNLNSTRADVGFRLGLNFAEQSWNEAAIAVDQYALRISPNNDQYMIALANVLLDQANHANAEAAPRWSAEISANQVVQSDITEILAWGRLDYLFATQAVLLRARSLNPLYIHHTINLARFYTPQLPIDTASKSQLVERAGNYYAQAMRLNPQDVNLMNEWADFDLTYRNDSKTAIQKYTTSIAINPRISQSYLGLGKAYAANKNPSQAIQAYRKTIEVNPESADAYSKLAFVYYQQGLFVDSIDAYNQFILLAPTSESLWEAQKNLALIYRQTGDYRSALNFAQLALQNAPTNAALQIQALIEQLRVQSMDTPMVSSAK